MDTFTERILETAYMDLRRRKKRVRVSDLKAEAGWVWAQFRDETIEQWAQDIAERVPEARLLYLVEPVFCLLAQCGQHWELPDDGWEVEWAAFGLASLRWLYREMTNRAPVLRYDMEEITEWLINRQPPEVKQLPLFELRGETA